MFLKMQDFWMYYFQRDYYYFDDGDLISVQNSRQKHFELHGIFFLVPTSDVTQSRCY